MGLGDKGRGWGRLCCDLFKLTRFSLFAISSSRAAVGKKVYNIPVLEFKKGETTQQTKTGSMPKNMTVNMELLEPSFTKDS